MFYSDGLFREGTTLAVLQNSPPGGESHHIPCANNKGYNEKAIIRGYQIWHQYWYRTYRIPDIYGRFQVVRGLESSLAWGLCGPVAYAHGTTPRSYLTLGADRRIDHRLQRDRVDEAGQRVVLICVLAGVLQPLAVPLSPPDCRPPKWGMAIGGGK